MNSQDISLHDIHLFVEVAKRGSFSATSTSLGVPVATLSRRIAALEKTLGLELLSRSTRRVSLTAIGQRYFDECAAHVEGALLAHETINTYLDRPAGTLRMSVMPGLTTVLPAVLSELREQYPQIAFEIELGTGGAERDKHRFDLILRGGKQDDSPLIQKPIAQIRWILVASRSYLKRFGRPATPEDLNRHERILTDRLQEWTLSSGDSLIRIDGASHVRTNSAWLGVQLAIAGIGIAWVPSHLALSQTLKEQGLEQVLPEWKLPPVTIYALSESRILSARAKVFLDVLARHLAPRP